MQNVKIGGYHEPVDYKAVLREIAPDYKKAPAVRAEKQARAIDLEEKVAFWMCYLKLCIDGFVVTMQCQILNSCCTGVFQELAALV